MCAERVRFESVDVRDVGSLVCEELAVSSAFRSWLLERLDLSLLESGTLVCVRDAIDDHETTDPTRDPIGVELGLESDDERHLIVVTAARGDGDAPPLSAAVRERIRARRDRALGAEWDDCRTVLLAPADAIETADDTQSAVDATLSLESLRDRLAARDTDRGDYRAALVAAAIEGGARASGGRAAAHDRTRAVVERYESLVADREPTLEIEADPTLDPDLESGGAETSPIAATLAIESPSLGDGHRLVHDLETGTVDLRLPGAAAHLRSFAARYASVLSPATSLLADGDALVLRRSVPAIDLEGASGDGSVGGEGSGGDEDGDAFADDNSAVDSDALEGALEAIRDLVAVSERVRDGRA